MTQNAIVTQVHGDGTVTVKVLRKSACSSCSSRHICGTARKTLSIANDPIGVKLGDTVELETASGNVLAYSALVFLAPVLLGLALYLSFSQISITAGAIGGILGFVLPFAVARVISSKKGDSMRPTVKQILTAADATPPCNEAGGQDHSDK